MNKFDFETQAPKAIARGSNMRWVTFTLAAYCATFLADARAVPITISNFQNDLHSIWGNSASTDRYSDFSLQDGRSSVALFDKFDSSLGTLLSAELILTSTTSHPTKALSLPEVSGLPIQLPLGAIAQDTERSLHNLFAYYDARVAYRADYRLTVDPLNTDLFTAIGAEAAFGSCARSEDLLFDIGNQNPHCIAGNNGSPIGNFNYSWGPLSGASLQQFIGNDFLQFNTRLSGDAYGHCDDDDVGDYCRVNLAMNWNWRLSLSYTYEPEVPGPGDGNGGGGNGGGGDPVAVPEPGTLGMLGIALLGLFAMSRQRGVTI